MHAGAGGESAVWMQRHKHFLFLQGPHGPFFFELSRALLTSGSRVSRIGLNRGDQYFWPERKTYTAFTQDRERWGVFLAAYLDEHKVTDVVLYGDTRPIHRDAKRLCEERGLNVHCFEEGYLRPYWISYERGGANGNSPLMQMSLDEIMKATQNPDAAQPDAPVQWGAMWRHTYLGSLYHANVLFRNGGYPNYASHRKESVLQEWLLHCKRLVGYPASLIRRRYLTHRLFATGLPFHVAILQLGHDASVQDHSGIGSMEQFVGLCLEGFAKGAPRHHQLIFKAHPLEDGREDLSRIIAARARDMGLENRVWFIPGGKLGPLLDRASSAVTVNSTAGQQALWRGLPLKVFGRCVYDKPEFVSDQPLDAFFADPKKPDAIGYRYYRQFLLETSQVLGGYYAARGREAARRSVVDMMLDQCDPYASSDDKKATPSSKLTVVSG